MEFPVPCPTSVSCPWVLCLPLYSAFSSGQALTPSKHSLSHLGYKAPFTQGPQGSICPALSRQDPKDDRTGLYLELITAELQRHWLILLPWTECWISSSGQFREDSDWTLCKPQATQPFQKVTSPSHHPTSAILHKRFFYFLICSSLSLPLSH